ncbi:MAG: aspartate kinase, partial [Bdellovibrionota bacterium]|nr:aspartate kinase [Bdellovibrionota bacterium]
WLNAREVLYIKDNSPDLEIDWELSKNKLEDKLKGFDDHFLIITGFVASTSKGVPTTLKRNGSDISATIFGHLLKAREVSIWSDVDGIMSANPCYVPGAKAINSISYSEAMEMAYFGAKILHPKTLAPIIEKKIPLKIKNTFNPDAPGTLIGESSFKSKVNKDEFGLRTSIKGISNVDSLAVINVEGTNLIGIPGVVGRVFKALQDEFINVLLISQASSDHSICFCVPYHDRVLTIKALEKELYRELKENFIQTITTSDPSSILAVVGENMIQTPGVASRFFGALGKANINVRAIAQGSSERNISAVISQKEVKRAMKAVHASFYLSAQTLSIGLIGPGLIGKAILKQLKEQKNNLKKDFDFDFRIRGICNSKKMILSKDEIDLSCWEDEFKENSKNKNLKDFIGTIHTD